jgi:hypothetical protein
MGFLERWNRNRDISQRLQYTRRHPLETVGAIIFVFCKPLFVIGMILTIVIYTEKNPTDSIASFRTIGPVCLSLSALFFVIGGFMSSPYFVLAMEKCKYKGSNSTEISTYKEEPVARNFRVYPLNVVPSEDRLTV